MKKLALIMALVMALSLTSCGKDKGEENKPVDNNQQAGVQVDENVTEGIESPETSVDGEIAENEEETSGTPVDVEPRPVQEEKPVADPPKPHQDKKPVQELPREKPVTPEPPAEQEDPVTPEPPAQDSRSLNEIMASILTGMGETPMLGEIPLDSENFEFFSFAPYVDGAEGLVSEPMMGSFAHSVVLVRLPDGADVEGFANQVRSNADPRKWICVEAEEVKVSTKGNLVLLVMSSKDNVNVISSNFLR